MLASGAQVPPIDHEEGGRYRFLRELGRGSMGTVRLVYDRVRRQNVALKRVLTASPTGLLRLKREFRVVAPLRHRNLVRLYELWSDEDGPFFTMEFIEGHDLRFLLRGRFPSLSLPDRIRQARDLAAQLLPALVLLHRQGIIHRDLKPSNLMVGVNGVLKLVDFGLLAAHGEERAFGLDRRGAGTPPYMAPEQARGEPPTPASDMYSLGVLLLEMTVGRFPREGETSALAGGGLPLSQLPLDRIRPELPKEFARLCEALLQRDHHLRPDALSALSALADKPSVAVASVPSPQPRPRFDHAPAEPGTSRPRPPAIGWKESKGWVAGRLERIGDGLFEAAVLEGPPFSGKSALLGWTGDRARRAGGFVLVGRGRPDEHLDYNVLDAAVDALAGVLLEMPLDAELASDVALASAAFPVLAGRRSPAGRGPRLRDRAFDALIRILASLAGAAGVYLLIDDLHWADADSLAFLGRLLERRPTGVGLIATIRDGAENAAQAWLTAQSAALSVRALSPLRRPDAGIASSRGGRAAQARRPKLGSRAAPSWLASPTWCS